MPFAASLLRPGGTFRWITNMVGEGVAQEGSAGGFCVVRAISELWAATSLENFSALPQII